MYFFATRALFYFTLLVRDKLEYAEKILILRWEIISYLLTLIAAVVVGRGAARRCRRSGGSRWRWRWACSALLTRRILEEAIGAEDLNKVHLMETAIASNATLQGSFDQIERLAYRLLDWGDFRIYRVVDGAPRAGLPRHAGSAEPGRAARGRGAVPRARPSRRAGSSR